MKKDEKLNETDLGLDIDQFLRAMVETDADSESPGVMVSQERLLELIKAANDTEKYRDLALLARTSSSTIQKRIERAASEYRDSKVRELLEQIIPSLESFILAFENKKNWPPSSVIGGLEMAFDQELLQLSNFGLSKINAVGNVFDPTLHEAIGTSEKCDKPNIVVKEMRPGFTFKGKVLRASQVIVSVSGKGITKRVRALHSDDLRKQ